MSRQLLILRHAKSAWNTGAPTDFDRPLAPRGQKAAPKMGSWLKKQGIVPDHVVSSPARRAKQTVKLACKKLGYPKKSIQWEERIYGAGVEDFLSVLAETPSTAERVMIVGHNPGLEFLFAHLVGTETFEDHYDAFIIKTATSVLLQMPDDWTNLSRGCAKFVFRQHPRELP
ncbi:MAG: histidine phosphatase family protein [Magnetococcales bacterium]|nr:histidine phosphatase family protein [Magnetococcales bacterium]